MGYLLAGYWFKESGGYDINWTMPGCVLCLRMIGLAMDGKLTYFLQFLVDMFNYSLFFLVHDGTKKEEEPELVNTFH